MINYVSTWLSKDVLSPNRTAESRTNQQWEDKLTKYWQIDSYSLESYVINDVIDEAVAEIINVGTQPGWPQFADPRCHEKERCYVATYATAHR